VLVAYTAPPDVNEVRPVPPLVVANVPARVIVPLDVIGPPEVVNPVVPPDTSTEVTVPPVETAIFVALVICPWALIMICGIFVDEP
jgi:hypothetical protein